MKTERTIIPAAPGWVVIGYIEGLKPDQSDAELWKEPILAWEIERREHEGVRHPVEWHEVTAIAVDGSHLQSHMLAHMRPNGTIQIPEENDLANVDQLLVRWRKQWIEEHKEKAA